MIILMMMFTALTTNVQTINKEENQTKQRIP